ncbi:type I restriction-modification system subunit M [Mesorhizobium sp. LMG 17147]|uniref:type I restriction-modification system subunit M n=1 Tax=Mesorhizobium sp. LMG 17147 TaxID=2963091 RepID=UPI0020C9D807|nr:class I SAM-dependent DNA methyltransferase [Mesorhizobium sp. LMG 17147]MCP9231046.1 type I restriction-modification system subunit M [Mesorhizobium sp. LMG 17147]
MPKLTKDELFNHLWRSADILRGSIDSSDYKIYIFGFLFLKRLSDRFEEEVRECVKHGLPAEIAYSDPDEHEFFVPERGRWNEIQKLTSSIGDHLNKACAAIEDANPSMQGVLVNIDFNSESRLGDEKNKEKVLSLLIRHFSYLDLSNASLSEPDLLGRAYEKLIEWFADDAGKKGGEFYTPHPVVKLIVELLNPQPAMRISDPTCGSGGMLIESARHVADIEGKRLGQPINVTLHGQEKNLGTWAIAKMNLLLHGLRDARIEKGDTIRNPRLLDGDGNLLVYDRVIANPPFSLDSWGADDVSSDAEKQGHNRFIYGIPPKNMGDLAFVQHMVATLNTNGVCGVVMPHGVLFRGAGDGRIREGMLKDDLFEAIIGLPENLFAGTGIPATVLILNKAKLPQRKGKVLFIYAAKEFVERPKKNVLSDGNIRRIVDAFRAWKDEDRFSRVVELKEIVENDFNLNISRYIDTLEPEAPIDVKGELEKLRKAELARDGAVARMNALLEEMGYVE